MSNTPPPPSSQQPPPPQTQAQVPPTPAVQDGEPTRMAIDALQRGSDAYTPAPKRVGNVLFHSSAKRPSISVDASASVGPATSNATPSSTTAPSANTRTPASSSSASTFVANRSACLNNYIFDKFRTNHIKTSRDFVDAGEFDAYKKTFTLQTNHRFALKYQTASVIQEQLDAQPRTRSEARAILESFDSEAMSLQTSEPKRLSRLHLEDLFTLTQGDPLKFYVSQETAMTHNKWWGDIFIAALREIPESAPTTRINGNLFHCFNVNILNARLHDDMRAGVVSEKDLKDYFDRNEGFSITFGGLDHLKFTISWKQVVEYSSSWMFFGPPTPRNRVYSELFEKKTSLNSIRAIFHWYSQETAGDYTSSNALLNAYLDKENKILLKKSGTPTKSETPTVHVQTIPEGDTSILTVINEDCKRAFQDATCGWTDPQAPLLTDEMYKSWIDMMKVQYCSLWMHLCRFRGITGSTRGKELVPGKERQVLNQILAQLRNRNSRVLVWWALIESVALMAWGMGRTSLDKLNYWGTHVFSSTRDRMLNSLFGKSHAQSITEAFAAATVIIFIIDNYQKGQRLKNQRGDHSSSFLVGTNQIAELAFLYSNPAFDERKPLEDLSYAGTEVIVSPDGMVEYENYDGFSPSSFFETHHNLPCADPDFTGNRVKSYMKLLRLSRTLQAMKIAFSDEHQKHFPSDLDALAVQNFRYECRAEHAKKVFKNSKSFQREAVLKWNPQSDEVTPSIMIGMNAMEEAASMETGAIVLELLTKAGVMSIDDDGKFAVGDLSKFIILAGDVKTVDNLNLIQETIRSSMKGRGFTELSHQLSVFDQALSRVMDIPGDWHAGLSMLQSIVSLFYDALLHPILYGMLGWRRFNRETNKCYYTSARGVILCNTILYKVTFERFIAQHYKDLKIQFDYKVDNGIMEIGEGNFMCHCAVEFQNYLKEELASSDEWRRACAVFLVMSSDFMAHVDAYRKCDAIAIEMSYLRFAPVWRIVGANRYLERVWHQQEALYTKFGFRELQIVRINRCSRPHHGETGKGGHSKDEKMEFFNGEYARFPTPRTKTSFVDQSRHVGLAKQAKNTVMKYYTVKPLTTKKPPRSASSRFDQPQQQFLYELFTKMETSICDPQRRYCVKRLIAVGKSVTTDLKLKSVEDRMIDKREYDSDHILSSLRQCILEKDGVDTSNLSEEDKAQIVEEEEEEAEQSDIPDAGEEDERMLGRGTVELEEEVTTEDEARASRDRGFNVKCLLDIWHEGKRLLSKDGIKEKRKNAKDRDEREKKMMDVIGQIIKDAQSSRRNTRIIEEPDEVEEPDWMLQCQEMSKFG